MDICAGQVKSLKPTLDILTVMASLLPLDIRGRHLLLLEQGDKMEIQIDRRRCWITCDDDATPKTGLIPQENR